MYGNYNTNIAGIDAGAFADDEDFRFKYRSLQTGTSLKYALLKSTIRLNYNYNWYDRDYTDDSASVGGFAKYQKEIIKVNLTLQRCMAILNSISILSCWQVWITGTTLPTSLIYP